METGGFSMGVIDDILKALDRIPGWTRIQQLPAEVDQLTTKVAALEELLSGKHAADYCRYCGARDVRLYYSFPSVDAKGNVRETWRCDTCEKEDERIFRPSSR